jgi:hypothetical protein
VSTLRQPRDPRRRQHPLDDLWDATTMTDVVVGFREGVGSAKGC